MDNKSDDQLLIIQDTIDVNSQDSDEKIMNLTENLTAMIKKMMDQLKFLNPHQARRIHQRPNILPL